MTMLELLIPSLFAVAVALMVIASRQIVAEVPRDDRQYMDPPPTFYRLTWPLVLVTAHHFGWLLREGSTVRIRESLLRAGQDYTLTPAQFFAGKVLAGMLVALVLWLTMSSIGQDSLGFGVAGAMLGHYWPELWLRDMAKSRNLRILKRLPFFLDIVTMAVEAGLNLSSALQHAVDKMPHGPLVVEINRLLREVRAGKPRADAMRDMAARLDFGPISSMVSALVQGEMMGSSLGPILRAQSEQRRTERFQRAEKLALEAPVKMLGPLIICIFPCTFIVLAFPIVVQLMRSGI
jgi:tight adherence protein C